MKVFHDQDETHAHIFSLGVILGEEVGIFLQSLRVLAIYNAVAVCSAGKSIKHTYFTSPEPSPQPLRVYVRI